MLLLVFRRFVASRCIIAGDVLGFGSFSNAICPIWRDGSSNCSYSYYLFSPFPLFLSSSALRSLRAPVTVPHSSACSITRPSLLVASLPRAAVNLSVVHLCPGGVRRNDPNETNGRQPVDSLSSWGPANVNRNTTRPAGCTAIGFLASSCQTFDNPAVQLKGPFLLDRLIPPPAHRNVVMIAAGTGVNPSEWLATGSSMPLFTN